MPHRFVLALAFLTHLSATASPFTDWRAAFDAAKAPSRQTLLGTWAGRCAESSAPDKPVAALYTYRQLGTDYDSHSHFLNRQVAADAYDHWTLSQAQHDSAVDAWLKGENWPSVFADGASVENIYDSNGRNRVRAVRMQRQGDTVTLYVRISRDSGGGVLATCRFATRLADHPPVPSGFLVDSGASEGGEIDLISQDKQTPYRAIQVINQGSEKVELSHLQIRTEKSWLEVPETLVIDGESSRTFTFSDRAEAVHDIIVFLSGKTKNLRFLGMSH